MKKVLALLLALVMLLTLAACASKGNDGDTTAPSAADTTSEAETTAAETTAASEDKVELTVFAAASMTETLSEVIEMYKSVAPNVTITPTFDSSGALKKQIAQGAECDLYISAAQKQMNQLDGSCADDPDKNPDKLDFIDSDTRVDILENKVVLVVPEGNPADIQSFQDLKSDKLNMLAIGNSDVPVGSYSLDVLQYLGLDVSELEKAGKVTYGSNVKEVTTQVSEGTVDCGIVYATDAYSAGLTTVDTATGDMCKKALYPAAVMKDSTHPDEAKAFLDYIRSDACSAVFEKVGFTVIK